jgi:hypothetical protein
MPERFYIQSHQLRSAFDYLQLVQRTPVPIPISSTLFAQDLGWFLTAAASLATIWMATR